MRHMRYTFPFIAACSLTAWGLSSPAQTAAQARQQIQTKQQAQHTIHDKDGDGICDVCKQPIGSNRENAQGAKAKKGMHWGPGDGTGNQDAGPRDGTGYGSQSGAQTGPKNDSVHGNRGGRRGGRP